MRNSSGHYFVMSKVWRGFERVCGQCYETYADGDHIKDGRGITVIDPPNSDE